MGMTNELIQDMDPDNTVIDEHYTQGSEINYNFTCENVNVWVNDDDDIPNWADSILLDYRKENKL